MNTSAEWVEHFRDNLQKQRIDWTRKPQLSRAELNTILSSLQAWQLGETSDGSHLLRASEKYARRINDVHYVKAVQLFIKEEQKPGNNLGRYLDLIQQPRIRKDWGDTLFRKIRYFNTSMELWTIAVITVESCAQLFYQSLKNATNCTLLQEICTDILTDEAAHIRFQCERLEIIFSRKPLFLQAIIKPLYAVFFFVTSWVVWMAHKRLFKAGGNSFSSYFKKMRCKYAKTIGRFSGQSQLQASWKLSSSVSS